MRQAEEEKMEEVKGIQLDESVLEEVSGGAAGTYSVYVVKRGDTLSGIAKKFHTTTAAIVAMNSDLIGDTDYIRCGWKLIVPERK